MLACKPNMCGYLLFAAALRSDLVCQAFVNSICNNCLYPPIMEANGAGSNPTPTKKITHASSI